MSDWTGVPHGGQALRDETRRLFQAVDHAARTGTPPLRARERGVLLSVTEGVARVGGLPDAEVDELLRFSGGRLGTVFNLDEHELGVVLLDPGEGLEAGERVDRTGRVLDVPVGEALLGRVVDGLGRPLDEGGALRTAERFAVERPAPPVLHRAPVRVPLQTGIKVVDALVPVGRGQRELIVGDRETGKTAIAVDTILAQRDRDVVCIYCAIGQRHSAVARVVARLRREGALAWTAVVVGGSDAPAGLRFVAPYAAMSMAEWFMERGRDALVVYDDLTRHARAYRELSLLLRRPPGREAYPGDIFHIHARLLERSTRLREERGGGSITVLPVVETQAQDISAYIPTNLISITDGQIYLSPELFRRGVLPAVDVGKSVSRVGGDAQRAAYRAVVGDLRLTYSQFHELERFSRFATQLDEETRRTLEHGRRIREVLRQPRFTPLGAAAQVAVLLAVSQGALDELDLDAVEAAADEIAQRTDDHRELARRVEADEPLDDDDRETLLRIARDVVRGRQGSG